MRKIILSKRLFISGLSGLSSLVLPLQTGAAKQAAKSAVMEAIRDAARRIGSRDLRGCILYSSSPACPMCEAAAYWANIQRMIYGSHASDNGRPALC